MTLQI